MFPTKLGLSSFLLVALSLVLGVIDSSSALSSFAPTADVHSSRPSAILANNLSGNWSQFDVTNNKVTSPFLFVQQGDTLLAPAKTGTVPFYLNITLFGDYGRGIGALYNTRDNSFCFYTDVVLHVVDTVFMKLEYFPRPGGGACTPFPGSVVKFARLY